MLNPISAWRIQSSRQDQKSGPEFPRTKWISACTLLMALWIGILYGISEPTQQQPATANLVSRFTASSLKMDGVAEPAWDKADTGRISIAMKADLSSRAAECPTYGEVRSMWNGALLYLLVEVSDPDITAESPMPFNKDWVEVFIDLYNDKFPKNEEDDGIARISSDGQLSVQGAFAGLLEAYAVGTGTDSDGTGTGYTVELALHTGGISIGNGTAIGMEFGINDAVTPDHKRKHRVFWSNGANRGIDDNTRWGTVVLDGYDGTKAMVLDTFKLQTNIKKAESLSRGIWKDESELDHALASASKALSAETQTEIETAADELDRAIQSLRRKGRHPDPLDLPEIDYLPDPFKFHDGGKVSSPKEWNRRRSEILDLAQYYEYGSMPDPPDSVTASIENSIVTFTVGDKGKSASFPARLTLPTGGSAPYPVIVSIDFFPMPGPAPFIDSGYAVLSLNYSQVASDDDKHTGAFFSLYPYDVIAGRDAGTILAWAWGASRAIDGLQYLGKNNPEYKEMFDLDRLVVTGFSRCGKAALLAGLFDSRFGVVNPGGSGSGGTAPYRYDSFGNRPFRSPPYGNLYPWGRSTGAEVMGDHVRHQRHNSNEMLERFLNPGRIYKTETHGYGQRLPFDHHELIAAIAPRAVIISTTNNDYANNAEGDSIGFEGAKPVYEFLGAGKNLAFDIRMTGGGHSIGTSHRENLIYFANFVFFGKPLPEELQSDLYDNPYIEIYDAYYGGLDSMMPWRVSTQVP